MVDVTEEAIREVLKLGGPAALRRFRLLAKATIGIMAVIILILAYLLLSYRNDIRNLQSQLLPKPRNLTLFYNGQVIAHLRVSQYGFFIVPPDATNVSLMGSFISQGKVETAIMTIPQYEAFTADHDLIFSSRYYYGANLGASINRTLPAGSYYFMFYNPNATNNVTIMITNAIVLHYTSNVTLV